MNLKNIYILLSLKAQPSFVPDLPTEMEPLVQMDGGRYRVSTIGNAYLDRLQDVDWLPLTDEPFTPHVAFAWGLADKCQFQRGDVAIMVDDDAWLTIQEPSCSQVASLLGVGDVPTD